MASSLLHSGLSWSRLAHRQRRSAQERTLPVNWHSLAQRLSVSSTETRANSHATDTADVPLMETIGAKLFAMDSARTNTETGLEFTGSLQVQITHAGISPMRMATRTAIGQTRSQTRLLPEIIE